MEKLITNKHISVYAIPCVAELNKKNLFVSNKTKAMQINAAICKTFDITEKELFTKTRKRYIVEARHAAMHVYKSYTDLSLSRIGIALGNFDHATVLHGIGTAQNLIDTNVDYALKVNEVKRQLSNI